MLEFQRMFATEDSCAEHLKALRWPDGFACPRCGHRAAWYIGTRKLLDCQGCRAQVSLTAGTIFHRTRTPLVKWYWLLYHMATDKVGLSVAQLQRGLEIPDYKTAWLMAHKVRKAMADRDTQYRLAGLIEMDDAFFGPRGTKRGRGSERKQTVLCAVALYRDRAGQERPGFAHMQVVADASARTVEQCLDRLGCGAATEEGQQLLVAIRSDGWRAYGTAAKAKALAHCKVVLRDPKAVDFCLARTYSEERLPDVGAEHSVICCGLARRENCFDPLLCPLCEGMVRIIAVIERPAVAHLPAGRSGRSARLSSR